MLKVTLLLYRKYYNNIVIDMSEIMLDMSDIGDLYSCINIHNLKIKRKMIKKYIITNLIILSFIAADEVQMLQSIKNNIFINNGWEKIEKNDNGISISVKEIPNIPIKAVLIMQQVDISPETIIQIIEDVNNYENVLKSATSSESKILFQNEEGLFAHQYLGLKYVKDRYYAFKMYRPYDNTNRIDWELIPKNIFESFEESTEVNTDGVYIDIGYGSWTATELDNGMTEVTYRLVMHPGGKVPNFVTDYINRVTIVDLFRDVINEALFRTKVSND